MNNRTKRESDINKPKINELFKNKLTVINVGPYVFGEAVCSQGIEVLQVDWKPPMTDDREMNEILKALGGV